MDLTHEALKMAGTLALVVLVLLGGLAWVRRTFGELPAKNGEPVMRILGGLRVGTGKHIMLVEVAGEVLVLGTTAREMTLLTTIAEADRIDRLRSITNSLVGPLGTWLGQWTRQAFGKSEMGSVTSKPLIRLAQGLARVRGEGKS
ncbi:flagellar biosynthetic protein FliO [Nitrospira sp. Ecomares 2.1]